MPQIKPSPVNNAPLLRYSIEYVFNTFSRSLFPQSFAAVSLSDPKGSDSCEVQ
jgi:hypothetical protein